MRGPWPGGNGAHRRGFAGITRGKGVRRLADTARLAEQTTISEFICRAHSAVQDMPGESTIDPRGNAIGKDGLLATLDGVCPIDSSVMILRPQEKLQTNWGMVRGRAAWHLE